MIWESRKICLRTFSAPAENLGKLVVSRQPTMTKIYMHGAAHWHRVDVKRVGMVLADDGGCSDWQHAIVICRITNLCLLSVNFFYRLLFSLRRTGTERLERFQPINSLILSSLIGFFFSQQMTLFLFSC